MRFLLAAAGAWLALAGCSDPFALRPASIENRVDTLTLYAVNGTPLTQPSALLLASRSTYRLGVDALPYNFDFLYRIHPVHGPELVPYAAVATATAVTGRSGLIATTTGFDQIDLALQTGYVTDSAAAVSVGSVLYLRSGVPNGCFLLIPYYAKLEVLALDPAQRSMTFRILININCGYRGLAPGLPEK